MSSYASTSIPKPKHWQDFESKSCILFKCILNDPATSTHGRGGQAQQGVDIYGRRGGQGDHWVGIQCKLKADAEEITQSELEAEVAKARQFTPSLSDFVVITTAQDDAKIQRVARHITQQHEKQDLFTVSVWGWQTLENKIAGYREALEAFHPDLTPFSGELISLGHESVALHKELRQDQKRMIALLEQITSYNTKTDPGAGQTAADRSSAAEEAIEQNIHREIDGYRDLLRNGKPRTARPLLEALKTRVWESASARVRFRIVTNIGAACLELGEEELAANAFLEATGYDFTDRVGMANVALAHILRAEVEQAIAAADAALQQDPGNAAAAGYLISGHLGDPGISDPFSLVPDGLHESAEVQASAINFLCQRGDTGWHDLARQSAKKHPEQMLLRRRAAEAVFDEAVSSERFEIGGTLPGGLTIDDLRNAVSVLQGFWDEARVSEARSGDTALPQNLVRALWALNESRSAASVLDQALERTPEDQELRELRAALHFEAEEPEAALALAGDNVGRVGLALMQAQTLLKSDPKRAREILHGKAFADAPDPQRLAGELLVIATFVHEGHREQALKHAERLVNDYDWSVEPLTELARVQRLLGKDEADQTLSRAVEKLNRQTRFLERFQVANALEDVGRYDDVVSVLEGHVDCTRDSPALRLLLNACINADRRTTAYELLRDLPAEVSSLPPYLRALVAVNVNRKDFPAALDATDRYLSLSPDDLEMRLRWASFCLRLNQQDRVEACLKGNVEALAGSPELRMELAHWLDRFAFEIDDGRGGKSWFVIEPEAELRKNETYIASDEEVAQRARGLRVGDTITWNGHHKSWTVLTIKHKYVHALHQSMERFERHFPAERGLRRVDVDLASEEPFEEIFKDIKRRPDSIQEYSTFLMQVWFLSIWPPAGLVRISLQHVTAFRRLAVSIACVPGRSQSAPKQSRRCAATKSKAVWLTRSPSRSSAALESKRQFSMSAAPWKLPDQREIFSGIGYMR